MDSHLRIVPTVTLSSVGNALDFTRSTSDFSRFTIGPLSKTSCTRRTEPERFHLRFHVQDDLSYVSQAVLKRCETKALMFDISYLHYTNRDVWPLFGRPEALGV